MPAALPRDRVCGRRAGAVMGDYRHRINIWFSLRVCRG